jgi:DNA-binding MarR family transcriptional regulator
MPPPATTADSGLLMLVSFTGSGERSATNAKEMLSIHINFGWCKTAVRRYTAAHGEELRFPACAGPPHPTRAPGVGGDLHGGDGDMTPVQFAILNALLEDPGEDQVTLARKVAFDPATFGSVITRLEARGWVQREPDAADRRRKLLWVTGEGAQVAQKMKRLVGKVQQRILQPLDGAEREQLLALLDRLVAGHENLAPTVE